MSPRKKILLQKSLLLTVRKKKLKKNKKKKFFFLQFQISKPSKLRSWTKYIGTRQKFTNFEFQPPIPSISMLKSGKFSKKSLSKLSSGGGGYSVGEEIYEIYAIVPFILSEIV